ncbi:hypothetical protein EJ03DRAFT_352038 [Teratosphaeria nubilosa]|uniref:Zn(2)-C6 fungal-type domain-containing protein n=1 Tax=Teratosphaeria nubilosa TaxID=161662 RepID=A0A6G1L8C9_9PEZI|nr:hypothetical protein EJ03DRAFT_352038 [Teratosphaeria nubilosa]
MSTPSASFPPSQGSGHSRKGTSGSPSERSTKRQKVTRACDRCKARKRRCNGEQPCTVCLDHDVTCTYDATYTRGRLVGPLPSSSRPQARHSSFSLIDVHEASTRPDVISEEIEHYAGPSSAYSFLRRAWDRFGQTSTTEPDLSATGTDGGGPIKVSVFAFGDREMPKVVAGELKLPSRVETTHLLRIYFELAMPTYRFLHRPTVEQWLGLLHDEEGRKTLKPTQAGTVLIALATASLFGYDEEHFSRVADEQGLIEAERYYQQAQVILANGTGRGRMESVQSRLAGCLYLLHTSRPNQAWYAFGTVTQLAFTFGLHRRCGRGCPHNRIEEECRKRTFSAVMTLDTYFGIMLGRPALIHECDCDQLPPERIDDSNLTVDGPRVPLPRQEDSVIEASIFHARLARIVRRAARELYGVSQKTEQRKAELAASLTRDVAAWHASLPVVISGAVHLSSLIPLFRRQITVMKLAHAHALMFINRPMLVVDPILEAEVEPQITTCLEAAKGALDLLGSPLADTSTLPAFWFTQYVAFNALSITFISIIRRRRKAGDLSIEDEQQLRRAEPILTYLTQAMSTNAPSLRYSVVLGELQKEATRPTKPGISNVVSQQGSKANSVSNGQLQSEDAGQALQLPPFSNEANPQLQVPDFMQSLDFGSTDDFLNLEPDLWLQLDAFPFSDMNVNDWTDPS